MNITSSEIIEYLNELQPMFGGVLGEIQKKALEDKVPIIPRETARFLAVLLTIKKPVNSLEIGAAVGFSAGLICAHMAENGKLTTIERYYVMAQKARENFRRMGITDKVMLIEGDASEVLPMLSGKYDFIFMDCAKGQYIQFMPDCLRLLEVGGILLVDNILQKGRVTMERIEVPKRQRTIHSRMDAFLQTALNEKSLESSVLPIGDGLLFATKIKEYE